MRLLHLLLQCLLSLALAEDDTCQSGTCLDDAVLSPAFIQSSKRRFERKETPECTGSSCLKPAWNVNFVDTACATVGDAHDRSLLEVNASASLIPHWSARRFTVDPQSTATMVYYGSADIQNDVPNAASFAVISMHGASRDAINYFCDLKRIMEAQSGYDTSEVLMIAPKFAYEKDLEDDDEDEDDYEDTFDPSPTDLWWNGSKSNPFGDYRLGAHSDPESGGTYSSFEILDRIVLLLETSAHYPRMRDILIMGHSAGGQVVQRYALTTHLQPGHSDVKIRYAVANPSSYAYLDGNRWEYDCDEGGCTTAEYAPYAQDKGRVGWRSTDGPRRRRGVTSDPDTEQRRRSWDVQNQDRGFWAVDARTDATPFVCGTSKANTWGYELVESSASKTVPYISSNPHPNAIHQAKVWYKSRNVVYFVGAMDTCTDDYIPGSTVDGKYYCDANCWTRDFIPDIAMFRQRCYRNRMDMRCQAMLQGPNRKERGLLFYKHLQEHYGQSVYGHLDAGPVHEIHTIDEVGHQGLQMFQSPVAMSILFPGLTSHHDPNKCRAYGNLDPDCCSAEWVGGCADDHQMIVMGQCGGHSAWCREYGCYRYECVPPPPSHSQHRADLCRGWDGSPDTDCCSAAGSSCEGGYQKVVLERCGQGSEWCNEYGCFRYLCLPP